MRAAAALAIWLAGCGAAAPTGSATTADATASGDAALATADDAAAGATACVTLTVAFAGCDAERLAECQREYAVLPADLQATVDTDGDCFRASTLFAPLLNASWPATPGTCVAALTVWQHWYHGGCEGVNSQVANGLAAFDPCVGAPAACASLSAEADCTGQQGCSWNPSAGCSGTPVACAALWQPGMTCASQRGCQDSGFSFCGQPGQPRCFFSGTL